ncbi:MAG: sigma-54 dependent transcriptional regulator [Deltaproteobacteria bacterium]|jgi:two-component system response regulator FlrC|nr:sigma-54 dependent transcriptional regulator [Deltaproteobacteria bacterium]
MGNILIVDDEEQMRLALEAVLTRLGHKILKAENGEQALTILAQSMSTPQVAGRSNTQIDFVISDMKMPIMDGLTLLGKIKALYPQIPVAMITAYGSIGQAVEIMRRGAFDFITKPFSGEDLESLLNRAVIAQNQIASAVQSKPKDNKASKHDRSIITNDRMFKKVLEIASIVAESNASVLIQGESGTGKELMARFIHTASSRRNNAFVAVNCAALPENLLESELFGHEKGAFTGAINTKIGKFEQADGGTILLDEISEMDLVLQAKLLRVLQEREVDRVGGTKPVAVDVRVLATTNRDLRQYVAQGKFREDLFYRLNVIPLYIPALRERPGDIRLLTEYFVRLYTKGATKVVSKELIGQLESYPWRGNVRELQNACERAVLLSMGDELKFEHFILTNSGAGEEPYSLSQAVEKLTIISDLDGNNLSLYAGLSVAEAEKMLINETLKFTDNNKTKAAEMLGISIRTLRNKLQEYTET